MKRLTSLLLALILLLSLAACGSEPVETLSTEPETQATIPETTAPTEDPRIAQYDAALALLEEGDYDAAKAAFEELGDYSDASDQARECDYRKAAALLAAGENKAAWELYGTIPGYKDADTLRENCRFGTFLTKTVYEIQGEVRYEISHVYEYGQLVEEITTYNENHPQYIAFREKNPVLRTVYEYDGNVTSLYTYDAADTLVNMEIRTYDDAGNMVRMSKIFVQNAANSYTYAYTYNAACQVVEELYWAGDGIGEGNADRRYVTEYDADGNMTRYTSYFWDQTSAGWKLTSASTYDYGMDDSGRVYWVENVESGGSTEYTYNSQGLVEKERIDVADSDSYTAITYTYDDQGNMTQKHSVSVTNGEEFVSARKYIYNRLEVLPVSGETAPAKKGE